MKLSQLTVAQYLDEQSKRFEFANHMSICEGSDSYKPKYTLTRIVDESANANEFIKNVEQSIVAKLHFNIDTTDKSNLLAWYHTKSNKIVDEAIVETASSKDLQMLAKQNRLKISKQNNCMVFESARPHSITNFVAGTATLGANVDKALEASIVDESGVFKCSLSNIFID